VRVHLRFPDTAWWREMTDVADDRPDLLVAQDAFRSGHAAGAYAVVDHPFELAVGVALDVCRGKGRDLRRHSIGEGNAGVLSIETMACDAIVSKGFLALSSGFGIIGQRVFLRLVTNEEIVLRRYDEVSFQRARRVCLAATQYNNEAGREDARELERAAHGYSVTWRVRAIPPWPEPQKVEQWPMKSPVLSGVKERSAVLPLSIFA
jgi:hypothetical protein